MGADIHVYIVKTYLNKSELIGLYNEKGEYISPYSDRNYALFDMLSEIEGRPIYTNFLPPKVNEDLLAFEGYSYGTKEINLADLKLIYVNNLVAVEEVEKEILKKFIDIIESYINFAEEYPLPLSYYKLVIWFDR